MDTKKVNRYIYISLSWMLVIGGCKPTNKLIYAPDSPKLPALPVNVPIKVVLPLERLSPEDSTQPIAYFRNGVRVGSPCSYANVLDDITAKGRSLGARTIRVRKIHPPDQAANCFRMEVVFYR